MKLINYKYAILLLLTTWFSNNVLYGQCDFMNPLVDLDWLASSFWQDRTIIEYELNGETVFLVEICDNPAVDGSLLEIYDCEGAFLCSEGGFVSPELACGNGSFYPNLIFKNVWQEGSVSCANFDCVYIPFGTDNSCNPCVVNDPIQELAWLSDFPNYTIFQYEYQGAPVFLIETCGDITVDGNLVELYDCEGNWLCGYGGDSPPCDDYFDNITFVKTVVVGFASDCNVTYDCNDIPYGEALSDLCGNCYLEGDSTVLDDCVEDFGYLICNSTAFCVNDSAILELAFLSETGLSTIAPNHGSFSIMNDLTVCYEPDSGYIGKDTLVLKGVLFNLGGGSSSILFVHRYIFEVVDCGNKMELAVSAYLEGAYDENTQEMRTALWQDNLLPVNHPYSTAPWNATSISAATSFPNNSVDWVLVEAKSGTLGTGNTANTTLVEARAGILLADGQIVQADGNPLAFYNLTMGDSYHFAVRHRNHLDVISANAIQAMPQMTYDFTTSANSASGANQVKLLPNGKYALYGGDYNPDGIILVTDFDKWKQNPAQLNSYNITDGTLDGTVQNTDNDVWFPNKAKIGSVEIRY